MWEIKMDSEAVQRKQKKSQIGENLEAEMIPMEHSERRDNKPVTAIKVTPCAYVEFLVEHVTAFVDEIHKMQS